VHAPRAHAGDTRQRLLDAAIPLFADRGFAGVTVRDICRTAHANLAAVNYHFGDKLGLYVAVAGVAIDAMRTATETTMRPAPGSSAADKLGHYVHAYVAVLVSVGGPGGWIYRLMRHEMADPTPAAALIVNEAIRPRVTYLSDVVAELLHCRSSDPRVRRCVISIQAQCLFYMPDPFRARYFGRWPPKAPAEVTAAAAHIATFSLAGIRALAKARR
jgi:AcrR family transcriptional regulator